MVALRCCLYPLLVILYSCSRIIVSYPQYQEVIPNGEGLPYPCKPNYLWHGIGHLVDRGGGKLNNFGKDFMRLGKKWSKSLCLLDSDNDGKSNGEELGDPNCLWKPGSIPERQTGLSHPAVCDPWDSSICKKQNTWVDCSVDELKCNPIYDRGMKNITLRMPPTEVPNTETNYMCTAFDLPTDGDYHVIANKPYIDNVYVMHHMLLFGCPDNMKNPMALNKPKKCAMNNFGCSDIIGLWTVGAAGECCPDEFGYRIGTKGYKRVVLQVHWNNPELKSDYIDGSGLVLYYTSKLRPYDAGNLMIGSFHFELPPGREEVKVVGTCSEECSKERLNGTIYVTAALNHMHYLGRKQRIEIIRGGQKLEDLTNEYDYNYDKPKLVRFKHSVEIKPGDELRTTCVFKTKSRINITKSGPGTNDEMCLGFLTYYPHKLVKRKFCGSWKSLPICEVQKPVVRGCHMQKFLNDSHPEFSDMREAVKNYCTNETCDEICRSQVSIITQHPCMVGHVGDLVRERLRVYEDMTIKQFYKSIDSCSREFEVLLDSRSTSAKQYVMLSSIVSFLLAFLLYK